MGRREAALLAEENARRRAAGARPMGVWEAQRWLAQHGPRADRAYCDDCRRNVRPVRPVKLGRILALGFVGHALTKRTACPICKGEKLRAPTA